MNMDNILDLTIEQLEYLIEGYSDKNDKKQLSDLNAIKVLQKMNGGF